jgi:NadR type nicotinamide-nucleotide adenylyltransferase
MPPHLGHQHSIAFAEAWVSELTVLLFSYPGDSIDGTLRAAWLREMFPSVRVVHAEGVEAPPRDAADFWARWAAIIRRFVAEGPEWFFSGDLRATQVAERLGATHVLVDAKRETFAISSTQIREDPLACWRFLPPCVRPYYAKRVALVGPESTGKTTLARRLAERYETVCVPEYARLWSEARRHPFRLVDVSSIARSQLAAEDSLLRHANRVLIADTNLANLRLWSERRFDRCPDWVVTEAARRPYDLTLVNAPDVPLAGNDARDPSGQRAAFHARCLSDAKACGTRVVDIRGSWDERWARATSAVDDLLSRRVEAGGPQ